MGICCLSGSVHGGWDELQNSARLHTRFHTIKTAMNGTFDLSLPPNHPAEPQVAPCVHTQHIGLALVAPKAVRHTHLQPVQPVLPPIRDAVSVEHLEQATFLPVAPPPRRAV